MNVLVGLYLAGAAVGLAATDAPWPVRVGLALLWPLGPIAFAVTIAILVAASFVAFPLIGAIVLAVLLALAVFM